MGRFALVLGVLVAASALAGCARVGIPVPCLARAAAPCPPTPLVSVECNDNPRVYRTVVSRRCRP
jgi:hypothetical protein